jgi:hypothetical protein
VCGAEAGCSVRFSAVPGAPHASPRSCAVFSRRRARFGW